MDTILLISKVENLYADWGIILVFLSSFVEITPIGFSIPGGTVIALGGFFANGGKISLLNILIPAWIGAWLTFLLAYFLGFKTGHWLVLKLRQEKNAQKAHVLLKNHGAIILTTSMLANLTRFWVAYVAGEEKYNFRKFFIYSGAASLTWTSLMVTLGYLAGVGRYDIEHTLAKIGTIPWIFVVIALITLYITTKKEFKNKL
ncbi:MAG TPA: VTT domain-containing protein [Patescibacteria group bacterium]|nr:VTT domain-containing protein [Patescibacteria group bacterium]